MQSFVYISGDGDGIRALVGKMSLADKEEDIARLGQAIDRGNGIFRSWALANDGKVIEIGGDEFRIKMPANKLADLPALREQYETATGATLSVGVGMRMSEADKALMAAKLQGKDRIQLYTEEVEEIIAQAEHPTEAQKITEEYLTQVKKSESPDYESAFHQHATKAQQTKAAQPEPMSDEVRAQVVKVLQDVQGHSQELEQIQQSNPKLYQSIVSLVQAMIAMARNNQPSPVKKSEGLEKDLMPGGKGDDMPDSDFDPEQLAIGIKTEMEEHGLDEARAKEVCKDHLSENKSYYSKEKKE